MARERATELEYLKWFMSGADFGPAHQDVMDGLNESFMLDTDKNIPEGYNLAGDGETSLDKD